MKAALRLNPWVAAICITALIASLAQASTVVTGETQPWNGGFSSLSRSVPRVLQQFYEAPNFASITQPVQITGMSWRLPGVANTSYPTVDITFAQYDVTLAKASAAVDAANQLTSTTFADNMAAPVVVRSGSLTIAANSFTDSNPGADSATSSGDFSYILTFTTPYTYTPGDDLILLVRHSGYSASTAQTSWNFDGYAFTNGSLVNTSDVNGTGGSFFANLNKIQFTYTPEPAAIVLLALGSLALGRRRRA
jgi:hypothetical protein